MLLGQHRQGRRGTSLLLWLHLWLGLLLQWLCVLLLCLLLLQVVVQLLRGRGQGRQIHRAPVGGGVRRYVEPHLPPPRLPCCAAFGRCSRAIAAVGAGAGSAASARTVQVVVLLMLMGREVQTPTVHIPTIILPAVDTAGCCWVLSGGHLRPRFVLCMASV